MEDPITSINKNDYALFKNFNQFTSEKYKAFVAKFFVARFSTYSAHCVELNRIRQLFANSSYPSALVDIKKQYITKKKLCHQT